MLIKGKGMERCSAAQKYVINEVYSQVSMNVRSQCQCVVVVVSLREHLDDNKVTHSVSHWNWS